MNGSPWTTREQNILRLNYQRHGLAGCVALLPHRTATAVRIKAQELGLTRPHKSLSDLEVRVIRQLRFVGRMKYLDLQRMFGKRESTLIRACNNNTYARVALPQERDA